MALFLKTCSNVTRAPLKDVFFKSINPTHSTQAQSLCFGSQLLTCRRYSLLNKQTERHVSAAANGHTTYTTQTTDERGSLVYDSSLGSKIKRLKIFSLCTSAIGLAAQPYLLTSMQDMALVAAIPIFGVINAFIFINPFLIHALAKRCVLELYFNPVTKVFTASKLTFFASKSTFTFTADDVTVPDVPGPFSMLTAKGMPLFMHEGEFTSIEVYKHMMGFDRPLDLSYDGIRTDSKKKPDNKSGEQSV